jgi:hypothetical protein
MMLISLIIIFLQVYFSEANDYYESSSNVNVVLATFVTAYGRLKMLEELTLLGDRVLYMDTGNLNLFI